MNDREMEPEDNPDAALAAEYVLRLLDPAEEAACAARVARDPAFAALVALWRADLAALDVEFPAVAPPAALGGRIEARLFGAPELEPSALARLWNSIGLWRGLAVAAVVAAGVFAAMPILRTDETPGHLVSSLAPTDSAVGVLAYFDPDAAALDINRIAGAAAPGRALELWLIPEPDSTPISLGVLPDAPRARIAIPRDLADRMLPGAVLAVTDEAPGGATGAPGTLLAAGPISEI